MSTLSLQAVVALCVAHTHNLGRIGEAVGIMHAESGFDTAARCYNVRDPRTGKVVCGAPGPNVISIDRGIWQMNSKSHRELSDAQADDPVKATQRAWEISGGFTNWGEWSSRGKLGHDPATIKIQKLAIDEASWQIDGRKIAAEQPGPAAAALGAVGGDMLAVGKGAAGAATAAAHATLSVGEFLASLSDRHTWIRILEVVGGAGAIILGAFLLDRSLVSQVAGAAVTNAVGGAANKLGASAAARGSFRLA